MKFNSVIVPGALSKSHYYGWTFIMNAIRGEITDPGSDLALDSFADSCFWGKQDKKDLSSDWVGILHAVEGRNLVGSKHQTLRNFFDNPWFLRNKNRCRKIITLTEHTARAAREMTDIPVDHTYHPKSCKKLFDKEKCMNSLTISHSGFHYRNFPKFLNFNTVIKKKIFARKNRIKQFEKIKHDAEVSDRFRTDDQYIDNLTSSLGFSYYEDAAASNELLEHIVSNTPIVVNRLPAVVEYIGSDYPLFYEDIEHEPDRYLTDDKRIEDCRRYLEERGKLDMFKLDNFKSYILGL